MALAEQRRPAGFHKRHRIKSKAATLPFGARISLLPADRPVEFADAVGAEFRDAVLQAFLLVFARAERTLDEKVRAFRESLSVFGKLPECDYAVPLGAALGFNTDIQLLRRRFTGVDDKSIANTRFRLEMLRSGGISLQLPPELCDVYA